MKQNRRNCRWLPGVLAPVLILAAFLFGVARLDGGSADVQRQQLEDSIRRACVACYATEGVYPPNLSYFEEHYGLQVDTTRYTVFYDIFAENLMPDITVVNHSS